MVLCPRARRLLVSWICHGSMALDRSLDVLVASSSLLGKVDGVTSGMSGGG